MLCGEEIVLAARRRQERMRNCRTLALLKSNMKAAANRIQWRNHLYIIRAN